MTGKTIVKRLGRAGVSLDLPMAALASLSVAFVAFAMPDALFSGAVEASGLAALLPAAQPPLGTTARLAVVVAGAVAAFLSTWLLLRALGGGVPRLRRQRPEEVETPAFRLRRADFHPDAPLRRPLVAGLELGEPHAPEEPAAAESPGLSPIEPASDFDEVLEDEALDVPEEPDDAIADPPMELEEPTIAHLMQRLELGLIRRQQQDWPPVQEDDQPVAADESPDMPPAVDDRLRSALSALQKMAARRA